MGSTGTGRFSDYPGKTSSNENEKNGGSIGEDKCLKAFTTDLEDVSRCHYFVSHNDVPPRATEVLLAFNVRLVATTLTGEEIGFLPTKFNYLKSCIDNGFSYAGHVASSSLIPLPTVTIDVIPS